MTIGCDIDGVLANFNLAYAALITKVTGIEFPVTCPSWPKCWNWEMEAGVSTEEQNQAWKEIKESSSFWYDLEGYGETNHFLRKLRTLWLDTYFVTRRMGREAKIQTEEWIKEHGFEYSPTVLLVKTYEKAAICESLGITHFIDDKTEACENIRDYSKSTKVFMLSRPWNRPVHDIPRLPSLMDFYNVIKGDENGPI
jgi:hypothetical protein